MTLPPFQRLAAVCAVAAGAGGLLYSFAFVALVRGIATGVMAPLTSLLLLVGGLLVLAVFTALYERLRDLGGTYALLAVVLGVAGAFGTVMHGGFDLAQAIHPARTDPAVPSQVDPRGLFTFGVSGLALFLFASLMRRSRAFPVNLAYLGYVSAVLLVLVYLARLIILSPSHPAVLGVAALEGLVVNPLFYIWLGLTLRRAA